MAKLEYLQSVGEAIKVFEMVAEAKINWEIWVGLQLENLEGQIYAFRQRCGALNEGSD